MNVCMYVCMLYVCFHLFIYVCLCHSICDILSLHLSIHLSIYLSILHQVEIRPMELVDLYAVYSLGCELFSPQYNTLHRTWTEDEVHILENEIGVKNAFIVILIIFFFLYSVSFLILHHFLPLLIICTYDARCWLSSLRIVRTASLRMLTMSSWALCLGQ